MANYDHENAQKDSNLTTDINWRHQQKISDNLSNLAATANNSSIQIINSLGDTSHLPLQQALYLHLPLAVMLTSFARFQPDDSILDDQMGPTIDALLAVGNRHGLPPWLTTAEYYLNNQPTEEGKRVTFTGHPAEELFIEISSSAAAHFKHAASLIDSISLTKDERSDDTVKLQAATGYLDLARKFFSKFNSDPKWDGDFFFRVLRGFSRPATIRGTTYPSKSIATNAAQRTIDVTLGLTEQSDIYNQDTFTRLSTGMFGQDTEKLTRALDNARQNNTLRERIARLIGVDKELLVIPDMATERAQSEKATYLFAQVDAYLESNKRKLKQTLKDENLVDLIRAYANFAIQNALLSGTHRGLIVNNIIRPQKEAERRGEQITVEQSRYGDEGLGGLPLEEVVRIQRVRQKDPFIYLLSKLVL